MQTNNRKEIELLDENGRAKHLSSTERKAAIETATDEYDPKLVQLLLGAKYCMLCQYWLVRAIFNFDMLFLSKMTKCELPLGIANKQLEYLSDKKHVNVKELSNIQESYKRECYKKAGEFYGKDRLLQIKRDTGGRIQLESIAIKPLVESTVAQLEGASLQCYRDKNRPLSKFT